MSDSLVIDAPVQAVDNPGPIWLEAMVARDYHTPYYGKVEVSSDKLTNFVKNFKEGVRGHDIEIDYDHKTDPAKGNKAAGWYKDFDIRPSSQDPSKPALFALVDFTDDAKKEIKNKEWKYFSLEWDDEWMDNDGNKHADVVTGGGLTNRPIAKNMLPINFSEAMATAIKDEMVEWEHSEPGTGSPPNPKKVEQEDDLDRKEGWRRSTPPDQDAPPPQTSNSGIRKTKEDRMPDGFEYVFSEKPARELLNALDLDSDTKPEDLVIEIKKRFGELDELKKDAATQDQTKEFAEKYPGYWAEHNKLMAENRENKAKMFAESIGEILKAEGYGLKGTNHGLSPVAKDKVIEVHKKFAEGSATIEDFEGVLTTIMNGGLIQFGEVGSSNDGETPVIDTSTMGGIADAKKLFAELMKKRQEDNPNESTEEVYAAVAKQHPDLHEASRKAIAA